jgi:hypothetical protein
MNYCYGCGDDATIRVMSHGNLVCSCGNIVKKVRCIDYELCGKDCVKLKTRYNCSFLKYEEEYTKRRPGSIRCPYEVRGTLQVTTKCKKCGSTEPKLVQFIGYGMKYTEPYVVPVIDPVCINDEVEINPQINHSPP